MYLQQQKLLERADQSYKNMYAAMQRKEQRCKQLLERAEKAEELNRQLNKQLLDQKAQQQQQNRAAMKDSVVAETQKAEELQEASATIQAQQKQILEQQQLIDELKRNQVLQPTEAEACTQNDNNRYQLQIQDLQHQLSNALDKIRSLEQINEKKSGSLNASVMLFNETRDKLDQTTNECSELTQQLKEYRDKYEELVRKTDPTLYTDRLDVQKDVYSLEPPQIYKLVGMCEFRLKQLNKMSFGQVAEESVKLIQTTFIEPTKEVFRRTITAASKIQSLAAKIDELSTKLRQAPALKAEQLQEWKMRDQLLDSLVQSHLAQSQSIVRPMSTPTIAIRPRPEKPTRRAETFSQTLALSPRKQQLLQSRIEQIDNLSQRQMENLQQKQAITQRMSYVDAFLERQGATDSAVLPPLEQIDSFMQARRQLEQSRFSSPLMKQRNELKQLGTSEVELNHQQAQLAVRLAQEQITQKQAQQDLVFENYVNHRLAQSRSEQADSAKRVTRSIITKSSQILTESALNIHQDPQELSYRQLQQSRLYDDYMNRENPQAEDQRQYNSQAQQIKIEIYHGSPLPNYRKSQVKPDPQFEQVKQQTSQHIEEMLLQAPKDVQRTKSHAEQRRENLKKKIHDTKLTKSQKDRFFDSQIPVRPKSQQKRLQIQPSQRTQDDPDNLCPPNQKLCLEQLQLVRTRSPPSTNDVHLGDAEIIYKRRTEQIDNSRRTPVDQLGRKAKEEPNSNELRRSPAEVIIPVVPHRQSTPTAIAKSQNQPELDISGISLKRGAEEDPFSFVLDAECVPKQEEEVDRREPETAGYEQFSQTVQKKAFLPTQDCVEVDPESKNKPNDSEQAQRESEKSGAQEERVVINQPPLNSQLTQSVSHKLFSDTLPQIASDQKEKLNGDVPAELPPQLEQDANSDRLGAQSDISLPSNLPPESLSRSAFSTVTDAAQQGTSVAPLVPPIPRCPPKPQSQFNAEDISERSNTRSSQNFGETQDSTGNVSGHEDKQQRAKSKKPMSRSLRKREGESSSGAQQEQQVCPQPEVTAPKQTNNQDNPTGTYTHSVSEVSHRADISEQKRDTTKPEVLPQQQEQQSPEQSRGVPWKIKETVCFQKLREQLENEQGATRQRLMELYHRSQQNNSQNSQLSAECQEQDSRSCRAQESDNVQGEESREADIVERAKEDNQPEYPSENSQVNDCQHIRSKLQEMVQQFGTKQKVFRGVQQRLATSSYNAKVKLQRKFLDGEQNRRESLNTQTLRERLRANRIKQSVNASKASQSIQKSCVSDSVSQQQVEQRVNDNQNARPYQSSSQSMLDSDNMRADSNKSIMSLSKNAQPEMTQPDTDSKSDSQHENGSTRPDESPLLKDALLKVERPLNEQANQSIGAKNLLERSDLAYQTQQQSMLNGARAFDSQQHLQQSTTTNGTEASTRSITSTPEVGNGQPDDAVTSDCTAEGNSEKAVCSTLRREQTEVQRALAGQSEVQSDEKLQSNSTSASAQSSQQAHSARESGTSGYDQDDVYNETSDQTRSSYDYSDYEEESEETTYEYSEY